MTTKLYEIYDMQTDEYIGWVIAKNVVQAEIIASAKYDRDSDEIYAVSAE